MLLALTLALLPSQDSPPTERGCIIENLAPAQRPVLAERFASGEMGQVEAIARAAAAKCAATWKWTTNTRDWQIVHSGAYAAMIALESQLPKALDSKRLEALFAKLSPADQYGLTIEGGAKLEAGAYTALVQRAGAVLVAEKVAVGDVGIAGNWLVAYAQFIESDAHLKPAAK